MKKILLLTLSMLFSFVFLLQSQHFIGLENEEVVEKMKEAKPDFVKCKVINKSYNYLKYQDQLGERTMLFFLDKKDKCTSVKLMSHYVYLGEVIADLNKKYESVADNQWMYEEDGKEFVVELEKGQWFFSVLT